MGIETKKNLGKEERYLSHLDLPMMFSILPNYSLLRMLTGRRSVVFGMTPGREI
jgi:hypothetical protein